MIFSVLNFEKTKTKKKKQWTYIKSNRTFPQQLENGLPLCFHWTLYLTFILLFIYQGEHSCVTFCYPLRQAWRQWFHCSISSCSVSAQQNMTEQMNQLSVPVAVPSQGEAKEVRRPD